MVDLVKIRKKSKDAKDVAAAAAATASRASGDPAPTPVPTPLPTPAAMTVETRPVETASPRKDERAVEAAPVAVVAESPAPVAASVPPAPPAAPVAVEQPAKPKRGAKAGAREPVTEPPPEVSPPVADSPAEPDAPSVDEDRLARFKRLAGKRRTWSAAVPTSEQSETVAPTTELELLRFRVAGEDYAVDIDKIVEIVPPRSTTRVPNAEESIVGIISLRGTIVTVIDLRRKLGHPRIDLSTLKDARMIVVERAGETAGFLVDRVSRVVKLERAQLENHPVVSSAEQSEYVSGVFQAQDGLVILLDIERILAG